MLAPAPPSSDRATGASARRATLALAAAVVAINLAVKVPDLGRQSLWLDEALTVTVAARPLGEIVARAVHNQNPPLYGVVMHFWIAAFGASETSVRAFPVACSTLAALGVALLARRFLGLRAAVFAAILFTGANLHVQYAREARVYALVTLLPVASAYVHLTLVTRPAWRRAALLGLVNGLLFHGHYVTAFVPLAQLVATLAHAPWRERAARHVVASIAATAILALPVLPLALRNAPRVGEYWLGAPAWRDARHVLKRVAGERRGLYWVLLLAVPAVRRALGVSAARFDRGLALAFACAAFLPVALAFAIGARVPVFLDRYLIFASPPLLLLMAYLLSLVPLSRRGAAVVALGLVAVLAPKTLREPPKDDWRALVAAVRVHHDPASGGSIVMIARDELAPFAYYWDRETIGAADVEARLRAGGIVGVERTVHTEHDRLQHVRTVAVVRTRLGAPDTSQLRAAGFTESRPWATVQGLEAVAFERAR